jgi:hypothetical protein
LSWAIIALPFVISTGADPDFLLRAASHGQIIKATGLHRKSGYASVEMTKGRAVL